MNRAFSTAFIIRVSPQCGTCLETRKSIYLVFSSLRVGGMWLQMTSALHNGMGLMLCSHYVPCNNGTPSSRNVVCHGILIIHLSVFQFHSC